MTAAGDMPGSSAYSPALSERSLPVTRASAANAQGCSIAPAAVSRPAMAATPLPRGRSTTVARASGPGEAR